MTRRLIPLLLVCSMATQAAAQEEGVPPNILVLFDTSGSMAWQLDSNDPCGGDGSHDFPTNETCRIFAAKRALETVLLSVGEAEARFALMRYAEDEGNGLHRFPDEYPRPINYRGTCERGGDLLVPFGADNGAHLLSWIDQSESYPDNRELRADGPTPLTGSLRAARDYYAQQVLPNDEFADCRFHAVILLSDGVETCAGDPCEAVREMAAIPLPDGGEAKVNVFVVGFGPAGGIQENALDDLAVCADTDLNGRSFRASDQAALQLALGRIIGLALPIEVCDERDNDCDGLVDEGVRNACGVCGEAPIELCNGEDDDCDEEIDEGVVNSCGVCGEDQPEVCNNLDDDCDGAVDEENVCGGCVWRPETCDGTDEDCDGVIDNNVFQPCGPSAGACEAGRQPCENGEYQPECIGGVGPSAEVCDGVDNDCDGVVDGQRRPCGEGVGACGGGQQVCVIGEWSDCQGAEEPAGERCNDLDDDCDGIVDEGVRNDCGECGAAPGEICNATDDDCDGRIDDGATCPETFTCVFGECTKPCFFGECPTGQTCVEDLCLSAPCLLIRCPAGHVCDPETAACVDPCDGVSCQGSEACRLGECVAATCADTGCDEGEVCSAGECVSHPCAGVDCGAAEDCQNGVCVPSCLGVACDGGQACVEGACLAGSCVDGQCAAGQVCVDGQCAQDPCAGVACGHGFSCEAGECVDAPCRLVQCAAGTQCERGRCVVPVEAPDAGADAGVDPESDAGVDVGRPGADRDTGVRPADPTGTGDTGCGSCNAARNGAPPLSRLWRRR